MARNETIKEKINIGKRAWELYINGNCQINSLFNYAHELGISPITLKLDYLTFYMNQSLKPKPTEEEIAIYKKALTNQVDTPVKQQTNSSFIDKMLSYRFAKELLNFVATSEYTLTEIFKIISDYISYNPDNPDCKRILRIDAYLKENKDHPLLIEKATQDATRAQLSEDYKIIIMRKIINQFLEDNSASMKNILNNYQGQFDKTDFNHYIEVLRNGSEEDKKLIAALMQKNDEKKSQYKESISSVLDYIKNVIANKNKFSILNYYTITNLDPEQLLFQARKLATSNALSVLNFNILYRELKPYIKEAILNEAELMEYPYHYKQTTISKQEQSELINYIKSIPAPLTISAYITAYQEYVDGKIKNNLNQVA